MLTQRSPFKPLAPEPEDLSLRWHQIQGEQQATTALLPPAYTTGPVPAPFLVARTAKRPGTPGELPVTLVNPHDHPGGSW